MQIWSKDFSYIVRFCDVLFSLQENIHFWEWNLTRKADSFLFEGADLELFSGAH